MTKMCHFERTRYLPTDAKYVISSLSRNLTMKTFYVYFVSNPNRTVLYIGVTNNLERRVLEHKAKSIPGFTKKYNCVDLVYYEQVSDIKAAIQREKQLKKWNRIKKLNLIKAFNPKLVDLSTR